MGVNIDKLGPNKWLLDVRVRKSGKEIRKRETFLGTRIQAHDRYFELRKSLKSEDGLSVPENLSTFGDLLKLYQDRRYQISGGQASKCGTLMADLGSVPIPLFAEKLDKYMRLYRLTPRRKTGKIPANASFNRYITLIRTVFNIAVDLDLIVKNPITKSRFPKLKEVSRDQVLTEQQRLILFNVIRQEAPHLEAITNYALQVPCRKSELIGMCKDQLDLFHNSIRVRNGTTKNDEGIWKPIPPDMVEYFRTLPPECPYLFYKLVRGTYRPLGDFKKSWKRCKQLAGVPDLHFHDTRHMSATDLLDGGTPEQVVLAVAGWKTNMLRTYYHRSGKKSLELIRFRSGSGHTVDTHTEKMTEKG